MGLSMSANEANTYFQRKEKTAMKIKTNVKAGGEPGGPTNGTG